MLQYQNKKPKYQIPQSQKQTHNKKLRVKPIWGILNFSVGQFSSDKNKTRKIIPDIWVLFLLRTKLADRKIVKDKKETDLHSTIKNSLV